MCGWENGYLRELGWLALMLHLERLYNVRFSAYHSSGWGCVAAIEGGVVAVEVCGFSRRVWLRVVWLWLRRYNCCWECGFSWGGVAVEGCVVEGVLEPSLEKTVPPQQASGFSMLLKCYSMYPVKGGLHQKPPKFEHIFVAVITFFPLSSVQILLISACCLLCVL